MENYSICSEIENYLGVHSIVEKQNLNIFYKILEKKQMYNGKIKAQLIMEADEILMNSTSNYKLIDDPSHNGFALIINGYQRKRIFLRIPHTMNAMAD